ncbi:MAG: hypothetical protein AB7N73_00165, partial [Gemmatimonadales bacterium]
VLGGQGEGDQGGQQQGSAHRGLRAGVGGQRCRDYAPSAAGVSGARPGVPLRDLTVARNGRDSSLGMGFRCAT